MKKQLLFIIALSSTVFIQSCKKSEPQSPSSPVIKNIYSATGTGVDYEQDLDRSIEAASYGLLELRTNPDFVSLVRSKAGEQFDGEYNILFKDLVEPALDIGIDIKSEMISALENVGQNDLIPYITTVIDGLDYFDTKAYLHIYIPFSDNGKDNLVPTIIMNNGQAEAPAIVWEQTGSPPNLILMDEEAAKLIHSWVIAVNERVGIEGKADRFNASSTSKTTHDDEFDGSLWIDEVRISSMKEVYVNGGPEVEWVSYSTLNGGTKRMVGYFLDKAASGFDYNKYHARTRICESVMSKIVFGCNVPNFFPNASAEFTVLFFERDFRKAHDREEYIVLGASNSKVTFGSQEGPYGRFTFKMNSTNPTLKPIVVYNDMHGLDGKFGIRHGNNTNTFTQFRFQ